MISIKTELDDLEVGQSIELDGLMVKRKRRNLFCAFEVGITDHSRWGNQKEITRDIKYFQEYGRLPRGKNNCF